MRSPPVCLVITLRSPAYDTTNYMAPTYDYSAVPTYLFTTVYVYVSYSYIQHCNYTHSLDLTYLQSMLLANWVNPLVKVKGEKWAGVL